MVCSYYSKAILISMQKCATSVTLLIQQRKRFISSISVTLLSFSDPMQTFQFLKELHSKVKELKSGLF